MSIPWKQIKRLYKCLMTDRLEGIIQHCTVEKCLDIVGFKVHGKTKLEILSKNINNQDSVSKLFRRA